jgi:signal peptidase I
VDREPFSAYVVAGPIPQSETGVSATGSGVFPLLRELLETVLPALLIALAINQFVVQPTRVDGLSMAPTLQHGERILIEKASYHLMLPARGDIVVLTLPGQSDPLIKRVVGVPGDVVAVRNGRVYLDGQPLTEAYLDQSTPGNLPAQIVPEGHVFVLGDNRGASNDSRIFGMVPTKDLLGRAWLSYWPAETLGLVR